MDTLDSIQKIIEQDSKNKWDVVTQNIEVLCEILPFSISREQLSPQYKGDIIKLFVFDSEDEKTRTIIYITNALNEIQIAYNNVIFMSFSQMEAILKHLIEKMDKLRDYQGYAKNNKSKSTFINMFCYLLHEKNCTLTSSEKKIFTLIDDTLRKPRNSIAHDTIRIVTTDDAIDFIADGINIDDKLIQLCSCYIDSVKEILEIVGMFFQICRKHFV